MAFQDLQALPEPVLRYFKYCLKEGQRPIKFCALKQRGAFRCLPACLAQAMGIYRNTNGAHQTGAGCATTALALAALRTCGCDADTNKLVPSGYNHAHMHAHSGSSSSSHEAQVPQILPAGCEPARACGPRTAGRRCRRGSTTAPPSRAMCGQPPSTWRPSCGSAAGTATSKVGALRRCCYGLVRRGQAGEPPDKRA